MSQIVFSLLEMNWRHLIMLSSMEEIESQYIWRCFTALSPLEERLITTNYNSLNTAQSSGLPMDWGQYAEEKDFFTPPCLPFL